MPAYYDATDLTWTSRGDLFIGQAGDLQDTYDDPLRSLYQEIRTRVMSSLSEWAMYQNIGASIEDYVGEPNNKPTAEAIKTRIIGSITRDGLVHSRDIKVRYAPIDIDKIMFRITISVAPTAINAGSNSLGISFLYDFSENNPYFVS